MASGMPAEPKLVASSQPAAGARPLRST
jgi:hypothetical protein